MASLLQFIAVSAVGIAASARAAPAQHVIDTLQARSAAIDYTKYVQPFFGSEGGGNMFPGVVPRPFSVVKLGPDLYTGKDAYSGYEPTGNVTGFSMMHETGTGGAPKYGVVAQMPITGNVSNPTGGSLQVPRAAPDKAEVGWYQTSLSSGVVIQLAATDHAGMFSYQFPAGKTANVVVDVSHVLPSFRGLGWGQGYAGGSINIATNGSYTGFGIYNNGWNLSPDWTIYFCGQFDSPPSSVRTFRGNKTLEYYGTAKSQNSTERLGAVFTFPSSNVTSRVGISFISASKACSYLQNEIPKGTAMNTLVSNAKDAWNTEVLSKITTTSSAPTSLLQLLYSSMYGFHIIPSNRTGDMPGWGANEAYYDDWFTLWDLFRCSTSLMHVFQPQAYAEMISGLINVYKHDGWMPDARSSNFNGRSQGGSNADNVLADAYVKGVQVNWTEGYAALKKDAEVTPPNNHDPISPGAADNQGRGALPDWLSLGWISPRFDRAVSQAIEYSANDFGLYQVAKGMGISADVPKYLNRSRNWRNHYNPNETSLGFSGFIVPRNADGSFVPQNPLSCGGCYWSDAYYEATPWEYLFNPTHDMAHLIQLCGGNASFVKRLETIFTPGLGSNSQFNNTITNPGNEPSFTSYYLFNFAGRQDLSVKYSRNVAKNYYEMSPSGLPGNSDAGAMQTWWLWSFIGLYPLTGQTTFLIGSPWLSDLSIALGGGNTLHITSTGSGDYVQSLRVNGQVWNKSWVTWDDVFAKGGTMAFVLGQNASSWAANGDPPPSPASV